MERKIECTILFVLLPVSFAFFPDRFPKIPILLLVTVIYLVLLLRDRSFQRTLLWNAEALRGYSRTLLVRTSAILVLLLGITFFVTPETLFIFPRERPRIWLIVMLLYPVLSAYAQEMIYRTFFFHRYRAIFKGPRTMIWASAAAFSLLHIIYGNAPAVIFSFIGGYLFSRTYADTQSLFVTSLEHALYGNMVFTVGLGHFFYEGL
jgi:membrane protease YdiL (CAAX protease family)